MNWVLEYHRRIEAGDILVSARVRKVYQNLAADILRPRDPWVFDEACGQRPIDFIEKFCRQSKGQWMRQPIRLDLWQKAFVQALFGFVHKETGWRRFKEVLLLVGRKNGKSTLLSGLSLYLLIADNEGGAEVYTAATKKDQARIIFTEAANMVAQSPELSRHIKKRKTDLYFPPAFSKLEALASETESMDGLNAHGVIIDELHAIKNRELYEVLKQSTSARQQPLVIMITTSGTVRECIYDDMYDYACDVVDGLFEDDRLLAVLYELDDRQEWTDWTMWVKANPGLGTIKSLEYLSEAVEKARREPNELPGVLCKEFNVRDTVAGSWLTFDEVNNEETFALEDIRDSYAIGGVDLSATTDLTCATLLVMKPGSETKYALQQYFLPEDLIDIRVRDDKIPYDKWRDRKLITACPGNKVDYSMVTRWFKEMVEEYGLRPLWVYHDPWDSKYWSDEMALEGFVLAICRQGYQTLSQPMKELEADLKGHRVNYNNNPVTKWCLTNVAAKRDENDNVRPVKGRQQRLRIDGMVSLLIAYVGLHEHLTDYMAMI